MDLVEGDGPGRCDVEAADPSQLWDEGHGVTGFENNAGEAPVLVAERQACPVWKLDLVEGDSAVGQLDSCEAVAAAVRSATASSVVSVTVQVR